MSNQTALDLTLDALGDPMRRRILERLSGGQVAVGDLAEHLPIGRPAVSRHLRVLTDAGLVEHTPRGTRNLYALAPDGQRELQQWLISLWDTALTSFADFVATTAVETPQTDSRRPKHNPTKSPEKSVKKADSKPHKKHAKKKSR